MLIGEMTDDEIALVAAEPEETTHMRNSLESRKATLGDGQETFKSAWLVQVGAARAGLAR